MAAIPSTQVVYFFFEETASEFDFFEELYTSRVAQVCKVCPIPHPWSGGGLAAWEPMGMGKRWVGRVHSLQGLDSTGSGRTT